MQTSFDVVFLFVFLTFSMSLEWKMCVSVDTVLYIIKNRKACPFSCMCCEGTNCHSVSECVSVGGAQE